MILQLLRGKDMRYLDADMVEGIRVTDIPRWGIGADGYTLKEGAPTGVMIRVKRELFPGVRDVWRRVRFFQWSNAPTVFVDIKGERYVVLSTEFAEMFRRGRRGGKGDE